MIQRLIILFCSVGCFHAQKTTNSRVCRTNKYDISVRLDNVPKKDKNSQSDPYFELFREGTEVYKSEVIRGDNMTAWYGASTAFQPVLRTESNPRAQYLLKIWDKDSGGLNFDDFIAEFYFTISQPSRSLKSGGGSKAQHYCQSVTDGRSYYGGGETFYLMESKSFSGAFPMVARIGVNCRNY